MNDRHRLPFAALVLSLAAGAASLVAAQPQDEDGFRFRTGVELVNVTATVTDSSGRFVSGLEQDDFIVYEDGVPQTVTHFDNERVPVSLGLVVDTSGSMAGEKWEHAREALDRFLMDHLSPEDEVFLYRFSGEPVLVEHWTRDRGRLNRAIGRIHPRGGTALYDTVADAVPLADSGQNRKKAVVIISDGNDTDSRTSVYDLKQMIRQTEVLVYAVGIDGRSEITSPPFGRPRPPVRLPWPFPRPGGRRLPGQFPPVGRAPISGSPQGEHVNAGALRNLTDDSGGRTEVVRSSRDLAPATENIADELSQQYYLAYPAAAKRDGRWHAIRVELRDEEYRVRARRGYMAD